MAYIKRYSCDLLGAKGIKLTVGEPFHAEDVVLPASVLINIIRIIQEACHNIIKHAEADNVAISFSKDGSWLVLTIEDNGKGFDPDAAICNGGHGLRNMEKRVKELGGEIAFTSISGQGTVIKARFPLT